VNFTTQTERDYRADDWDRMWNAFPRPCGEVERIMSDVTKYTSGRIQSGTFPLEQIFVKWEDYQATWVESAEKDQEIEYLRHDNKILGEAVCAQGREMLDKDLVPALRGRIRCALSGRMEGVEEAVRVLAGHVGPETDRREIERLLGPASKLPAQANLGEGKDNH
jgi:hypothetical protein